MQNNLDKTVKLIKTASLFALGVIFVLPILFVFFASFKNESQIFSDAGFFNMFNLFEGVGLKNYQTVLQTTPFTTYLLNSLIITSISVVLTTLINSMAAYALLRFPWASKQLLILGLLALLIVPFEAIVLPLVFIVTQLPWIEYQNESWQVVYSWFNSLHVQIIPELANPFFIFLFYQFFKSLPKDYEEAALLDGASIWQIFFKIVLPMSKPVLAAVLILTFLRSWNAYLLPVLVANAESVRPLMPGMQQFFHHSVDWGAVMAYASMITLPVFVVFIALHKYLISSIQAGMKQ
ncbi:carbohydrate ABC transporter permease [Catenovulum sediminis]|uniref:sn-glycerol-3-phosphate transport system permease protein UgpE n=1 Tax=Catenovulum sediminis TaxID=1740262 RepID=A0ABV1RJS0_9ALTE|nr:carbohydrate ABC transporter permease [Catenovulum sediminis]